MARIDILLLVGAMLILASILLAKVFGNSRVPTMLLFIIVGILSGSEGIGGIYFDDAQLAQSIGIIALMFILFSGGLDTNWPESKQSLRPAILLASLGVLITAVTVALLVMVLFKTTFLWGLLVGSIISSTDSAAVFSILRTGNLELKGKLKSLLELESGSNDPMAVFLTIGSVELILMPEKSWVHVLVLFILQFGIGTIIGFIGGRGMAFLVNRITFSYEGIYPVFSLALAILVYSVAATLGGSGFLAIYIAGIIIGNMGVAHKRTLIRFFDGLSILSHITLFLTLGLLVFPSQLLPVIGLGLLLSGFLMLIARPLSIFLVLLPFGYRFKEIVFTSWVGLRGAVPIVLTTFPLLAGVENAKLIFNIVFIVVLSSAILQGWSINGVARLLKLADPLHKKKKTPLEYNSSIEGDTELIEMIVPYDSPLDGKMIVDLALPEDSIIVLIIREDRNIIPRGNTILRGGDVLSLLIKKGQYNLVESLLVKNQQV
jgi:cell volume regulation protein A